MTTNKINFEYFIIELDTTKYEWKNFIVTDKRKIKNPKRTFRKEDKFFKVSSIKTIFRLSWNGKRLADSKEMDKFNKLHPGMNEKLNQFLKDTYK